MDPITAALLAIKAGFEMMTEAMRGQPLELRAKQWARWDADLELVRDWWKAQLPGKKL